MPQPPLVAFDNVYDAITLYPGATLSSSSEIAGREVRRIADGRRERTWWQPSGDGTANSPQGQWVIADVGATLTVNPNFLWLDRGHNLWGKTIIVERSTDGTSWTVTRTFTAPAITTTGGDPTTTTLAVTEEGALWGLVTGGVATRFHRVRVGFTAAYTPVITGLILGVHNQLTSYANRFDEDQGERTQRTETSDAGYRSTGRTYSWRRLDLSLSLIGATEYDATIRLLRQALFELNQPAFICMDYATKPERSWLYQLDGTAWSFSKERVHRTGIIPMREVGHALENRIGVGTVPSAVYADEVAFWRGEIVGGDTTIKGLYSTSFYVTATSTVSAWGDARGGGFAPDAVAAGSVQPAWDGTNKIITFDGTDDNLLTAASALFDLSGAVTLAYIGTFPVNAGASALFSASISADGSTTKMLSLTSAPTGTDKIRTWGGTAASNLTADSTVATGTTRRLAIATKTAGGTISIEVPNTAKVTAAPGNPTAGNNKLSFGAHFGSVLLNPTIARFGIVLNREATAGDIATLIEGFETYHAGVVA